MAKVTGPLLSMDASGTVGNAMVFSKWKGRSYVRSWVRPSNPKTPAQVANRAMMKYLSQLWHSLAALTRASWATLGAQLKASPFNAYVKENQKNWQQGLAPIQTPTDARAAAVNMPATITATAGNRQATVTVTAMNMDPGFGTIIVRNEGGPATFARSMVIAIVPYTTDVAEFVDTNLEPGEYYYAAASFTTDGALSAIQTTGDATTIV